MPNQNGKRSDRPPRTTEYDAKNDLLTERDIAKIITETWDCTLIKAPIQYGFDHVLIRGKNGKPCIPGRDTIDKTIAFGVDHNLATDEVGVFVEIKGRVRAFYEKNREGKKIPWYPDFIFSAYKVHCARSVGAPLIIVSRFKEGLGFHEVRDNPYRYSYRMAGRSDRNQHKAIGETSDIEPVLSIPMKQFTLFYRWRSDDAVTSTRKSNNTGRTPEASGEDQSATGPGEGA